MDRSSRGEGGPVSREKISAVLIVKNEERLIERCLVSCIDADQIVVLDTGSTDRTMEIARQCGADVFSIEPIIPFHFAEARNRALAYAKYDWCVSVDADEVVDDHAWKVISKQAARNHWAGAMRITFVMRSELEETPYPILKTKVFRKSFFEWRYRVHELLFPKKDKGSSPVIDVPEARIEHRPLSDKTARHGQNLELLRLCVKESPEYIRACRQLALELMLKKEWTEAIPYMAKWLALIPVDDPMECSEASCHIGECYAETGNLEKAMEWFEMASGKASNRREPLYRAAWWLIKNARLDEALEKLEKMLAIPVSSKPDFHLSIKAAWDDQGEPKRMVGFCKEQISEAKRRFAEMQASDSKKQLEP